MKSSANFLKRNAASASPNKNQSKTILEKKESSDSESLTEDSEREEGEKKNEEMLPLTCFKDLH